MFVCLCNGVTEGQIREAVADGACSLPELSARLGVASGCGTCADCARQVLHETLHASSQAEAHCAA
jgi:bacterioferritin-associated ferredoxin